MFSPYIPDEPPSKRSKLSVRSALLLYLLLVLTPLALKLAHLTRVATWPWALVTAPLWVPWVLAVGLTGLGWLLYLTSRE